MADSRVKAETNVPDDVDALSVIAETGAEHAPQAMDAHVATSPAATEAKITDPAETTSSTKIPVVENKAANMDSDEVATATPAPSAPELTRVTKDVDHAEHADAREPEKLSATVTGASASKELTPIAQLWKAAQEHGHPEVFGVTLADPAIHIPSQIVFQKYLNANDGDFEKAKDQLLKTLDWRAQTKPLELIGKVYKEGKFGGLGFITAYTGEGAEPSDPENKEIFTWNVYGAAKSIEDTFSNVEEFMEWRVALMELALQELSLSTATKKITAEFDPYKLYQVHDYKSISFFRQSSQVKSASSTTIKTFAQNYPELLKEKFFVNVPSVMGFFYGLMKVFVAAKTVKKFHPMSNGGRLALEFESSKIKNLGEKLPNEYGGMGGDLADVGKGPALA